MAPAFQVMGEDSELLSPERKARAAEMLMASSGGERERAYGAFREMGEDAVPLYRDMLKTAQSIYRDRLDAGLEKLQRHNRPFAVAFEKWQSQRDETMTLLRTSLDGDPRKIAELTRLYERAARDYRQLVRALKTAETGFEGLTAITPLREIARELDYCEGDEDPRLPSVLAISSESLYSDEIRRMLRRFERVQSNEEDHRSAENHNKKARWVDTEQRKFAETLNAHRRVFALSAFYLEERLSAACLAHCQEMAALGYFAHESPTPENASPAKRARRANYDGSWRGENIYRGGGGPAGAFRAWWNSDGHRFIMFADGGNHLGIATASGYWTLNTGEGAVPN